MSFDQLMPVFLSTPKTHEPPTLPFKFVGGFGLSAKTIGLLLSIQGLYSLLAQAFLFPFAVGRFGSLKTYRVMVMVWPLLYFMVPYLVLLPPSLRMPGVYFCLFWRTTAQVLVYPSNAILLTNSAPSLLVLGVINGVAASAASLMRAFGPTVSGLIHSWGLEMGYTGLAWWSSCIVSVIGAIESMFMEEVDGRMNQIRPGAEEDLIDPHEIEAAITAATEATGSRLGSEEPLYKPRGSLDEGE